MSVTHHQIQSENEALQVLSMCFFERTAPRSTPHQVSVLPDFLVSSLVPDIPGREPLFSSVEDTSRGSSPGTCSRSWMTLLRVDFGRARELLPVSVRLGRSLPWGSKRELAAVPGRRRSLAPEAVPCLAVSRQACHSSLVHWLPPRGRARLSSHRL